MAQSESRRPSSPAAEVFPTGKLKQVISTNEPLTFRQPPHNIEAEQALLGAILVNNAALDRVSSFLSPDHFFDPLHARIFETLGTLIHSGKTATPITVKTFFENLEPIDTNLTVPQYLGRLAAKATTIINAAEYGRTICDLATRRSLIIISEDLAASAYNNAVDEPISKILVDHDASIERLKMLTRSTSELLFTFAEDSEINGDEDELVKGVIPNGATGLLYGSSGRGKTFVAVYLASQIAQAGRFFGRSTQQRASLYVALEGGGRFGRRLRAAINAYGLPSRRVARLSKGITLGRGDGADASIEFIIDAVAQLAKSAGVPVGLVVIDTLAKALAGDNENEAAAISAIMSQAARIAEKTGAAVLIVHHPGKDAERGARGSSSLSADADFILRIDGEKGDTAKSLILEKAKDDAEGPIGGFTLEKVALAIDRNGDDITSMIVREVDMPPEIMPAKRRDLPPAAKVAVRALTEALLATGRAAPVSERIPANATIVSVKEWRQTSFRLGISDGDERAKQIAFKRAYERLIGDQIVCVDGELAWLPSKANSAANTEHPL